MSTILEDLRAAAATIADLANAAGYAFDFSARSLWEVDRFLDDNASDGEPKAGGLLSKDLGSRVFELGAYVGEVIRGAVGGAWVTDSEAGDRRPSDPSGDLTVRLETADGESLWPNQRVMKRILGDVTQGVTQYAAGVGVDPGPDPRVALPS
jgi:hypothetical protein